MMIRAYHDMKLQKKRMALLFIRCHPLIHQFPLSPLSLHLGCQKNRYKVIYSYQSHAKATKSGTL